MGRKSKVSRLPEEIKLYIEGLIAEGQLTLNEMIEQLRERFPSQAAAGELPSRAALHRYGPKLERRLIAIKAFSQAATSIEANAGDTTGKHASALTAMMQQELFDAMMSLGDATDPDVNQDVRVKLLSDASRSLASLTRSSVVLKEYQTKAEERGRKKLLAEQEANLQEVAKAQGMDEAQVDF